MVSQKYNFEEQIVGLIKYIENIIICASQVKIKLGSDLATVNFVNDVQNEGS